MMQTERLDMRADAAFLSAIDEWRAALRPIPSRTQAVRSLVLAGLAASNRQDPSAAPSAAATVKRRPKASAPIAAEAAVSVELASPWRDQRAGLRRIIAAHPAWPAIRDRDGLSTAKLSNRSDFRAVCDELGLEVPALS